MRKILEALIMVMVLILSSNISFAHNGSGHIFTGGYPATVVQSLKYVISGGDSNYQQNIIAAAANSWNGISSKVSVSLNSSGARLSIYKGTTDGMGSWGETFAYYSGPSGYVRDLTLTNIWEVVDIYGYDSQMAVDGFTDAEKRSTYVHEVGHALSLGHTNDLPTSTLTVMRQGKQSILPQQTDKDHLTLKWGN